MKTLKFSTQQVHQILESKQTSTWRINDDKSISLDDEIECIDKKTNKAFGRAIVNHVSVRRFSEIELNSEAQKTLQKYYGSTIGPDVHVKFIEFTFKPYPELKDISDGTVEVDLLEIKMFADGGSRGNPGPSASGFAILDMADNVVKKSGIYLGITTNNQAEYHALKLGLEEARKFKVNTVHVYMDSLLVINQMKGIFKVKNRDLWPIHEAIKGLVTAFDKVTFQHVPRELNKLADGEVNEVLDAELKVKANS